MAYVFKTGIDLNKNPISNGKFKEVDNMPATSFNGHIVNYSNNLFIFFDGAWYPYISYPIGKLKSLAYNDVYGEVDLYNYNKSITAFLDLSKFKYTVSRKNQGSVTLTENQQRYIFSELYSQNQKVLDLYPGDVFEFEILAPFAYSRIRFFTFGLASLKSPFNITITAIKTSSLSFDAEELNSKVIFKEDNYLAGSNNSALSLGRVALGSDFVQWGEVLGSRFQKLRVKISLSENTVDTASFFGFGAYGNSDVNRVYRWDYLGNMITLNNVVSKEQINFDINTIEPTQTGSSVEKTSTWIWQYFAQSIAWLRDKLLLANKNAKFNTMEASTISNSAFEVVSSLPTTNLKIGRQVFYNGKPAYFNGVAWVDAIGNIVEIVEIDEEITE